MKFNDISNSVKSVVGKVKFKGKQHSPEILLVTGIATGVAALGVAVYQSITRTPEVIEETKETLDKIHEVSERQEEDYTPEDKKKDLVIVYTKTSLRFAKVYAPAIILEVVSIASILASNNIIKSRNAALASAYAAVDRTFRDYRRRVVEELGEEADNRFRYNIKAKTVDKIIIDENGEAITKPEEITIADISSDDPYVVWFDESCFGWDKDTSISRAFLNTQVKFLNDRLRANGYLFLNEVRTALGLPITREGQVVGWRYDPSNPNIASYVDFGIMDAHHEVNREFINGWEPYCLLTFNCDGPILNNFEEK